MSCITSCFKNTAAARARSLAHSECCADTVASLAVACGMSIARCCRCSAKTALCKASRLSLYSAVSSELRCFSRPRIAAALMVTHPSSRRAEFCWSCERTSRTRLKNLALNWSISSSEYQRLDACSLLRERFLMKHMVLLSEKLTCLSLFGVFILLFYERGRGR